MKNLFHYSVIKKAYDKVWKGTISKRDIIGTKVIKKTPYYIIKNKNGAYNYIYDMYTDNTLSKKTDDTFPFKIVDKEPFNLRNEYFERITEIKKIQVRPEKHFSFRELVDTFADFEHTHEIDFKLFKIIMFAALFDRINVRISTKAGFGKDSIVELMGSFVNDVSNITPHSVSALTYRADSRLLAINEISNLKTDNMTEVQTFITAAGDFKNEYENPKRGNIHYRTKDVYDISKLSVVFFYNVYEYFILNGKTNKFFDNAFIKYITDRYLPIRFDGILKQDFSEPKPISQEDEELYMKLLRTIYYYLNNPDEIERKYDFKLNENLIKHLSQRHVQSLKTIAKYISEYAKDEEEFKILINRLFIDIMAYYKALRLPTTPTNEYDLENNDILNMTI